MRYFIVAAFGVILIPTCASAQSPVQGNTKATPSQSIQSERDLYRQLDSSYREWLNDPDAIVDYTDPAWAADLWRDVPNGWKEGFVDSEGGVKIHYIEAGQLRTTGRIALGPGGGPGSSVGVGGSTAKIQPGLTILFVPGWTMPGWIWEKQIAYFSRQYHVVAMDPRSQGESTQTSDGLFPAARARDIAAVIEHLHLAPVVLVGWSMAVAEVAAFVEQYGTGALAGIVLVDGAVNGTNGDGQEALYDFGMLQGVLENREAQADAFIRKICFQRPQPEDYLQSLITESKRVPTNTAVALLVGYFTADYTKTLPKMDKPALVIAAKSVDPKGVANMSADIPHAKFEVMDGVGHAVFADDPDAFNSILGEFLLHNVVEGKPLEAP